MKNYKTCSFIISAAVIAIVCSGCSHSLTVKNIGNYRTLGLGYAEGPVSLGVVSNATESVPTEYVRSICMALQTSGCASRVIFPYNVSLRTSNPQADVIVRINPSIDYSGSGWNFLINWPGFLIFAPAWNGYIYSADMEFQIAISDAKTKETISNFSVPIRYDIRHAAMNRTWTEVGWFEVGIIPLIGGLVFTEYDDNVSELLFEKVRGNVGNYVAEKIASRIHARDVSAEPKIITSRLSELPTVSTVEIPIPRIPIRLAIIDLDNAASLFNEARAINQIISDEFFDTRCYTLIERNQIQKIIKEHSFQRTGMTEDAVAIGKMLSVDYVLIGSLDKLGERYILSMRMIDIKLNRVVGSERLEHQDKIERITGKIKNAVQEITIETIKSVR